MSKKLGEEQVTAILKSAKNAVIASGVDESLKGEAFKAAVALLTGGRDATRGRDEAGTERDQENKNPGRAPGAESGPLDQVAAFLNTEKDGLHHVFRVHEGVPILSVRSSQLPGDKKNGAAIIALLTMAARQGVGLEEFTSYEALREEAKRYGKLDESNFSKALKLLDRYIESEGGKKSQGRKLTQPGIEYAASKVEEYRSETTD